jgi:hypothetical protein
MKLFIVFISVLFLNIQPIDLNTIRNGYKEAAQDETKITWFNKQLSSVTKKDKPVLLGYKGAGIALKARYAKKIKDKKQFFIEGVTLLEYALEKDPNNIELRLIRLGIQENTPKLLKYKAKIEEDKRFILSHYKAIKSSGLKKHTKAYVLQSKRFSIEEKKVFLN